MKKKRAKIEEEKSNEFEIAPKWIQTISITIGSEIFTWVDLMEFSNPLFVLNSNILSRDLECLDFIVEIRQVSKLGDRSFRFDLRNGQKRWSDFCMKNSYQIEILEHYNWIWFLLVSVWNQLGSDSIEIEIELRMTSMLQLSSKHHWL